ncbi:uncharacterized protein LOC115628676 [Scaptodrosophila lebanonensis]|uniref:Uncharacterized protein LOC115628676 n=1 Tax=Drosophila lebanonensis TaxID=7225 RepID=A0A6J2TYK9_DROLE|nr:uncharacterized protein LOC115628676 [Scaptodrosophila lebanonensis]
MTDPIAFKLFKSVDPTKINVPIKEKFAKLTLSSNKKKQEGDRKTPHLQSRVSRNLLDELNIQVEPGPELEPDPSVVLESVMREHPIFRSDSSSVAAMENTSFEQTNRTDLDRSDYMEPLQLSAGGSQEIEIEVLSQQVSNLTMQPRQQPKKEVLANHISICISSSSAEDGVEEDEDDDDSCITISDSEDGNVMETSEQQLTQLPPVIPLNEDKLQRIEAFLHDVSIERHQMLQRGADAVDLQNSPLAEHIHTTLANADTESMSLLLSAAEAEFETSGNAEWLPQRPSQPTRRDSSKRLADNDTEPNTLCSEELGEQLSLEDTLNETPPAGQADVNLDESLTIPETSSEFEESPQRQISAPTPTPTPPPPVSSRDTSSSDEDAAIQVSSINISAKINIKIQIPTMDASSTDSDPPRGSDRQSNSSSDAEIEQQRQERPPAALLEPKEAGERSILVGSDASDVDEQDEQFLSQAEKLLNQLYGKAWQTPDVIRTLKRSSGSGGRKPRTPLTEVRRQPKAMVAAATTARKKRQPPVASKEESILDDFSIFKRAIHANKMNSTQLPFPARAPTARDKPQTKPRILTNHKDEARWRALVDTDSGSDASDDDEANATITSTSSNSDNDHDVGDVTYLDLTSNEVQVVPISSNEDNIEPPKGPKRLDDILRTCRAVEKPKLPATPPINTRRQLFTPNTGYEDDEEAERIVNKALEMDVLDDLADVYLPGTPVHRRLQQVRRQLGLETPTSQPVFKPIQTPQPTPTPQPITKSVTKTIERKALKKREAPSNATKPLRATKKFSFIKSLEPNLSRELCDNEAYFYREQYAKNREELTKKLCILYNKEVFNNELDVPVTWSKLLRNTAGRCKNKCRFNKERSSVVELSLKVLTSADRLRCTLIHELCHAAAWIFDAESGHGHAWRQWTHKANKVFPDLPPIRVCHNYDIEYKYTLKCLTCDISSQAHSKSRKVEHLRCKYCRGNITVFLNKKDKSGNMVLMPVREPTGFAKFVKENYSENHRGNHKETMRTLSAEYAKQKAQVAKTATQASKDLETLTIRNDD